MKKIVKGFIILGLIVAVLVPHFSVADVGDFESYDSDWDSGWDSDWGSSYDSDYGYYGSGSSGGSVSAGMILLIVVIILLSASKNGKITTSPQRTRTTQNGYATGYMRNPERSAQVANTIKETDKFFNEDQFITKAKNNFIQLQNAWSERDWEIIRPIESESLFEQHAKQLKGYIDRGQINKLERISVNFAELVSYAVDNEKETLVVALNSSMIDYILDEKTGNVLKGDRDTRRTNTYKLSYIRKKGVKTQEGTDELHTTNCPNCGAPTKITSSGKCEYCGSVITIGEHDWVLNDMERF